jgi:hypothetical protein
MDEQVWQKMSTEILTDIEESHADWATRFQHRPTADKTSHGSTRRSMRHAAHSTTVTSEGRQIISSGASLLVFSPFIS